MSISDKTRKILWGRSGNRCAICKHELVVEATPQDDESVVGEECHIISPQGKGPRHDPKCPKEMLDSYENLILLCRIHHKMVDDQNDTYNVEILRQMKRNHEKWVTEKLDSSHDLTPLRIKRIKKNIPAFLQRITTGKQILHVIDGSSAYLFDNDELETSEEVDLIGGFLEVVRDWGELGLDLIDPGERVSIGFDLTQTLKDIEEAGFFVFRGREVQILEGGKGGPSDWVVAYLRVCRKTNQEIINFSLDDMKTKTSQQTDKPEGKK